MAPHCPSCFQHPLVAAFCELAFLLHVELVLGAVRTSFVTLRLWVVVVSSLGRDIASPPKSGRDYGCLGNLPTALSRVRTKCVAHGMFYSRFHWRVDFFKTAAFPILLTLPRSALGFSVVFARQDSKSDRRGLWPTIVSVGISSLIFYLCRAKLSNVS